MCCVINKEYVGFKTKKGGSRDEPKVHSINTMINTNLESFWTVGSKVLAPHSRFRALLHAGSSEISHNRNTSAIFTPTADTQTIPVYHKNAISPFLNLRLAASASAPA